MNHERAIRKMVGGLELYIQAHKATYDSPLGDDYVLGPEASNIANGLLGLLNGETGAINRGDMCRKIRSMAERAGLKEVKP